MQEIGATGKILMFAGAVILAAGLFMTIGSKYIPLGKLPGDIVVRKGSFTFFFPVVTCIVISIIISVVLNLFFRR